jgi:hypothetical protein
MTPGQGASLRKAHSRLHAAKLLAGEKLFDFAARLIGPFPPADSL